VLHHVTYSINSLCHFFGKRGFDTPDQSRNLGWVALLSMGEGWHNNHHAYQSSARQGFRRWEIDPTFYILKALSWLRIVWDLKTPPAAVLRNEHRLGARVLDRAAAQLAASFYPERIALALASAMESSQLAALQEAFAVAQHRAAEMLAGLHLPHLPTRQDILARGTAMFATTPSIEQIADRAHGFLLDAIGTLLCAGTVPARAS
jgi:stearoyl-CoA desaturase (Delta-9 desaturase)